MFPGNQADAERHLCKQALRGAAWHRGFFSSDPAEVAETGAKQAAHPEREALVVPQEPETHGVTDVCADVF